MIAPTARLAEDVVVGEFTIVYDGVKLGPGSVVESHCELGLPTPAAEGRPLVIGAGAHIRSHSVFYGGSRFGTGLRTGHGYDLDPDRLGRLRWAPGKCGPA